jgi:predicted kinase
VQKLGNLHGPEPRFQRGATYGFPCYVHLMATVHMIHGYLGAGKTTFARKLEQTLPALRLTHDEWVLRLYGEDPSPEQFQVLFDRVSERIDAVWTRCASLGLDVVLDLNFWSRRQRDEVRSTAAKLGAKTLLYHLSCTDGEAWARIEQRNRTLTDSLFIDRNTFLTLKSRFEPLGDDEARVEVSG